MLHRQQVVVEHREVRVLADGNGDLGSLNAKLLHAVDGKLLPIKYYLETILYQ